MKTVSTFTNQYVALLVATVSHDRNSCTNIYSGLLFNKAVNLRLPPGVGQIQPMAK